MGNDLCCAPAARARSPSYAREELTRKLREKKLSLSADTIDRAVTNELRRLWSEFNINDDAGLSKKDVVDLEAKLKANGYKLPLAINSFDFNRSGVIDRYEFEAAMQTALHSRAQNLELLMKGSDNLKSLATEAWNVLDVNEDGKIQMTELTTLLEVLSERLGEPMPTKRDICEVMTQYDTHKTNMLTREDFDLMMEEYFCKLYYIPRADTRDGEDGGSKQGGDAQVQGEDAQRR